jgi:hypothetical protein
MRGRLFALLLLGALLVTACGKRAGGVCKPGESVCTDKTTVLTCRGGTFTEVACRGALGCNKYQDHANCDDSVANEGEACVGAIDEEYACSTDKRRALVCKNGRFERYLLCRGKAGCAMLGLQVSCDTSISAKGDPCKVQGSSACSDDQKELLICENGSFAHHRYCRGRAGCYTKDDAPACDETLSLEGDECGLPGFVVGSVDGRSELICQGGRFAKSRACKTQCTVIGGGRGGIDCR